MNVFQTRFLLLLLAVFPLLARAGGDEVVVIYNKNVPESKSVADYYARLRQVPEKQIFGFSLTTSEQMSRLEFHDDLQVPLAKKLEQDGLWKLAMTFYPGTNSQPDRAVRKVVDSKIRYAVLCYGVPLKIAPDESIHATTTGKTQPELQRNEASVDSELSWLPLLHMDFPLAGPFPNWLYAATNITAFNPTNGILVVARLDGPTSEIARKLVDKALQAERDGLWGRAYFDLRNTTDPNYKPGDEWIGGAAEICRELGFETITDNKPETFPASFPMSQIAIYAGWYSGEADGPFAQPKVEFMPGAFAYHLHSFSAATVRSATQNWVGPLLAKGATCTMGCVNEPYLAGTPNVAVFIARWIAAGFTFGEAAYASQPVLSWQTTVIGDPLYRPFAKSPQELHAMLLRQHSPLLEWSYLRLANLGLVHGTRLAEVAALIDNLDATTNSAILTEKLADLYDTQGKPASAIMTYQKALQLHPSPEQRIRLRLALGEKLQAQGRQAEAIEDYQHLLAESPDYPSKDYIVNTLAALQQKNAGTNAPATP